MQDVSVSSALLPKTVLRFEVVIYIYIYIYIPKFGEPVLAYMSYLVGIAGTRCSYRRNSMSGGRLYQMGCGDCILVSHHMHVRGVTTTWHVSCCD